MSALSASTAIVAAELKALDVVNSAPSFALVTESANKYLLVDPAVITSEVKVVPDIS